MNKRFLKTALLLAACGSMPLSFTSCKDYDDDINSLQTQIDAINVSVGKLQELIGQGYTIRDLQQTSNGIVLTMSDGKSYEINDGKPGTAWTIGDDGYWWKDGEKTSYRAIGSEGAVGPQGPQGTQGSTGATGNYYKPNAATGNFDLYDAQGKLIDDNTGISWRTSGSGAGMSAVYSGNKLVLGGVKGADGKETSVEITVGTPLGTLAFVPSVLSEVGGYPTTDKPFYHVTSYYNGQFQVKSDWDKSNVVALEYRVSPQDAYIPEEAKGEFLNRVVKSRAEGDMNRLMGVASFDVANANATGVLVVNALYNQSAAATQGNDIAAFQLWNGQVPFTTDYIAPSSKGVDAVIINSQKFNATGSVDKFFPRRQLAEDNATLQAAVPLEAAASLQMTYTETLDLSLYVDLYSTVISKLLKSVDFDGISYEYSLPKEYKGADRTTNQQWFVQLDGSVLSLNEKNLTGGLTSAIGRTPVVRVDARMVPNNGVDARLVASAYVKVEIVREQVKPGEDQKPNEILMDTKEYKYSQLTASHVEVGKMSWMDVNNRIYGQSGLSSDNFWNYYGGAGNEYEVEVSVIDRNNSKKVLNPGNKTAVADSPFSLAQDGIFCEVTLGSGNTETSAIKFEVNNLCKTDETYKNVDGRGAEYTVAITVKSDNKKVKGDVIVKQVFYVLNDYQPYKPNPNYAYSDNPIVVRTKGKVVNNQWVMQMNIEEVFEMKGGRDIFQYFADGNNVASTPEIAFGFRSTTHYGIEYNGSTFPAHVVGLTAPLATATKTAEMKYTVMLVNGEEMVRPFDIIFRNPFKAGDAAAVTIDGNKIGGSTANAASSVKVVDLDNQLIYSWVNNALGLSSLAKDGYKLDDSMVSVSYAWVTGESDYQTFVGNLAPNTTFTLTDGVVTFNNLGATLERSYTLHIKATVTFKDLSEVYVTIPVKIKGSK